MKKVTHKQLETVIKICYERKIVPIIWGAIGIGKSDTIRKAAQQLAKENNIDFSDTEIEDEKFGFQDIRISQLEPIDLRGLPQIVDKKTIWCYPSWLPRNKKSKGILFFDELNLAPPSIQAACYQLILNRRIGDYILPEGWLIVAAGNRLEDNAKVFDLPSPLANRLIHVELAIPEIDEWVNWASEHNIDTRLMSFLSFQPSYLYKFDAKNRDKAFPTPRSYEFCSKLIMNIEDEELLETLISATVGEATAVTLTAFLKLQKTIDIDNILKRPESVKNIKEVNLKYALLSYVSERYRKDKKILKKIFVMYDNLEAEFGILLMRFCKAVNTAWVNDVNKEREWGRISTEIGKFL